MSASAAMYDADHAGWIYKQGSMIKSWKKRFMVLRGKQLTYYDTAQLRTNVKEKGSFQVITVELSSDIQNGLLVHGRGGRVLKLYTESAELTNGWYHAIMDAATNGAHRTVMDLTTQRLSLIDHNQNNQYHTIHTVDVDSQLDLLERLESLPLTDETSSISHEGWLIKEGMRVKNWKKRWFTLHGDTLSYYHSSDTGSAAKGYGHVRAVEVLPEKPFGLNIRYDNGRILRVCAASASEMEEWLCKLSDAIEGAAVESENLRQSVSFRQSLAHQRSSLVSHSRSSLGVRQSIAEQEKSPVKGFTRPTLPVIDSFHSSSSSVGNQTESGREYGVDSDESDGDWI